MSKAKSLPKFLSTGAFGTFVQIGSKKVHRYMNGTHTHTIKLGTNKLYWNTVSSQNDNWVEYSFPFGENVQGAESWWNENIVPRMVSREYHSSII